MKTIDALERAYEAAADECRRALRPTAAQDRAEDLAYAAYVEAKEAHNLCLTVGCRAATSHYAYCPQHRE